LSGTGLIALIVAAAVAFILLVAVVAFMVTKRRRTLAAHSVSLLSVLVFCHISTI
jgi:hypothetical protein